MSILSLPIDPLSQPKGPNLLLTKGYLTGKLKSKHLNYNIQENYHD